MKWLSFFVFLQLLFSCAPQIKVVVKNSYLPREDDESLVIYKKAEQIPSNSAQIGKLEATCVKWMKKCDSISIFSIAETKIKKAGGNALLITKFEKPSFWNYSRLLLNGDIYLVHDFSSPPDTTVSFVEKQMFLGFGMGPETGISFLLPKFSYYNFQNRKFFETYYGVEGSAWIAHVFWLSLNCLYGVKKDLVTFDTSLGAWWFPKLRSESGSDFVGPYFHTTINPKIGVKFWKLWLKAGPSIHLYRNYSKDPEPAGIVNIGKLGNTYYNFEILIKL